MQVDKSQHGVHCTTSAIKQLKVPRRVREERKTDRFQHIVGSIICVTVDVQVTTDAGQAVCRNTGVRCGQNVYA